MRSHFFKASHLFLLLLFVCVAPVFAQPDEVPQSEIMQRAVDKFLAEKITPEQGWERNLLNKEVVLYALEDEQLLEKGRGFWNPGQEVRSWTGLLIDKSPEVLQDWTKLSSGVQIRIALTLLGREDERGSVFLQKLIDGMSRETPNMAIVNAAIYNLSNYYRGKREFDKAIATALLIEEFTDDPATLANNLLSAARASLAAGDKEGSARLYDQIINYGYGWTTGHVYNDQARQLFKEGKLEEGRALLKKPIEGINGDQIRVVLDSALAESYYSTGEWEQARFYAKAGIDHYNALANPIKNHGLEFIVENSKHMSERIKMWEKKPVQAFPETLTVKQAEGAEPIYTYFTVQSYRKITPEVVSDNPLVKCFPLASPYAYDGPGSQMVGVEIKANMEFESSLTIKFKEFPDQQFTVKVAVKKQVPSWNE